MAIERVALGPRFCGDERVKGLVNMTANIGKRLLTVIPTLIGVGIVTFILTRALHRDPAVFFSGPAGAPSSANNGRGSAEPRRSDRRAARGCSTAGEPPTMRYGAGPTCTVA